MIFDKGFGSPLDAVNAVSSAVDVLASIQSRMSAAAAATGSGLDPMDRLTSRGAGLREMMRRATNAAAARSAALGGNIEYCYLGDLACKKNQGEHTG